MIKKMFFVGLLSLLSSAMNANTNWVHVYDRENKVVYTSPMDEIQQISHSFKDGEEVCESMMIYTEDGDMKSFRLDEIGRMVTGTNIPTIRINTLTGEHPKDKVNYLDATFEMVDYAGDNSVPLTEGLSVRLRGNSTMGYPKKPYRLKFSKKIKLHDDLKKAKSYVLLANFIDCSLMRNAVAMKIAQLLEMPYTNHIVPVNLEFNGQYMGSYMLTEKIGINSGSLSDIDETTGVLLELDTNYDEKYKFKSALEGLPVMIKGPDFDELYEADQSITPDERLSIWKDDFEILESAVVNGDDTAVGNMLDMDSFVDFMMVNLITGNQELQHPKSVYMYCPQIGLKYRFGPVWDFDWAYMFYHAGIGGDEKLPSDKKICGRETFFVKLMRLPSFQEKFVERWSFFKDNVYPQVVEYMEEYAKTIEVSAFQNGEVWGYDEKRPGVGTSATFHENYEELSTWLRERIECIDNDPNYCLTSFKLFDYE